VDGGASWTWAGSINQLVVVALGNDQPTSTGIGASQPPSVPALSLHRLWPNPAGSGLRVNVAFELSAQGDIRFELYDVTGRRVADRPREFVASAGGHSFSWGLPSLPSGVYFLRVSTAAGLHAQQKLVIAR
jgi:hypothetical protein